MVNLSITISAITLNVNVINSPSIKDMDYQTGQNVLKDQLCCLQELSIKYKNITELKAKVWNKIYSTNSSKESNLLPK